MKIDFGFSQENIDYLNTELSRVLAQVMERNASTKRRREIEAELKKLHTELEELESDYKYIIDANQVNTFISDIISKKITELENG